MPASHNLFRRYSGQFVIRLLCERLARAGLSWIPIIGSPLETLTFGVADRLLDEQLRLQVKELAAYVLTLAKRESPPTTAALTESPAALSIADLLTTLSKDDFRLVTRQLLALASSNGDAGRTKDEMHAIIVELRSFYSYQVQFIREAHSRWIDIALSSGDVREIGHVLSAIQHEARIQSKFGDRRVQCLDTPVLRSFVLLGGRHNRFPEQVASRYLVKHSLQRQIALSSPHLHEFSKALRLILRDRLSDSDSLQQLLCAKPQIWPDASGEGEPDLYLLSEVSSQLKKETRFQRVSSAANAIDAEAITMMIAHNRLSTLNYVSLVTETRALFDPSGLMGGGNDWPVQSVYGAAWGLHASKASISVANAVTVTTEILAFTNRLKNGNANWNDVGSPQIRPLLDSLGRLVSSFHDALAQTMEELSANLEHLATWLDALESGATALDEIELRTIQLMTDLDGATNSLGAIAAEIQMNRA
jgi:hypothetical protein